MNLLNLPHMLLIFIILLFPVSARAIPAITCHCFTDRSYRSGRPAWLTHIFWLRRRILFLPPSSTSTKKAWC